MPVIDSRPGLFPTLDTMPTLPAAELVDRQSCKFTGDISQCDVDGPDLY